MSSYEGMSKVIADKERKLFVCEYCGRIVERPYVHNNLLGPDRTTKVICTQPECNRFLDYSDIHEEYMIDLCMAVDLGFDIEKDQNYIINFSLNRQLGIYDELRLPEDRKPKQEPLIKDHTEKFENAIKEYKYSEKLKHLNFKRRDERTDDTMTKLYTNMMIEGHIKENLVYNPPVAEVLNDLYSTMLEQRENEVLVKVSQQIGIDIDKERFIKAMNADKELYSLQQKNDFLERCLSRACQLLYASAQISHEPSDAAARRKPIDWRVYIVDEQICADNAVSNLVNKDTNDEEDEE